MSQWPLVCVVIVNWRRAADTKDCLESLLRLDYRIGYAPESLVYHKEGATTGASVQQGWKSRSPFADACELRSRLLFTRRFFSKRQWMARLVIVLLAFKRLMRGDYAGSRRALAAESGATVTACVRQFLFPARREFLFMAARK